MHTEQKISLEALDLATNQNQLEKIYSEQFILELYSINMASYWKQDDTKSTISSESLIRKSLSHFFDLLKTENKENALKMLKNITTKNPTKKYNASNSLIETYVEFLRATIHQKILWDIHINDPQIIQDHVDVIQEKIDTIQHEIDKDKQTSEPCEQKPSFNSLAPPNTKHKRSQSEEFKTLETNFLWSRPRSKSCGSLFSKPFSQNFNPPLIPT